MTKSSGLRCRDVTFHKSLFPISAEYKKLLSTPWYHEFRICDITSRLNWHRVLAFQSNSLPYCDTYRDNESPSAIKKLNFKDAYV